MATPPSVETVFFRLHCRLISFVTRTFSPRVLHLIEALAFFNAVTIVILLIWMHYRFVTMADSGCLTEALRREMVPYLDQGGSVDVVKLHLSGIWSSLQAEDAKSAANLAQLQANHDHDIVSPRLLNVWLQDPTFVYSSERGFLMLDEATRMEHGVKQAVIRLRTESDCFQDSVGFWERYLLDNFIGYDTVVLNVFGAVFKSQGYLYSVHSRELLHVSRAAGGNLNSGLLFRAVLFTSFLFFISTTMVHHIVQQTQERMLKFTFDLQRYVQNDLPYRGLVFNHVLGSLVFVPIMVGMLFFLFEFFHDQLLSFMILAVVWIGELYSAVVMRTAHNIRVFPRLFALYFFAYNMYFFSYPSGFAYLALTTTICLLQHAMLTLFVGHEIPALLNNAVSQTHMRAQVRDVVPAEMEQAGGYSLAWILASNAVAVAPAPAASLVVAVVATAASPGAGSTALDADVHKTTTAAGDTAFIARPARKKRTTLHAEPAVITPPSPTSSGGTAPPPTFVGSPGPAPAAAHAAKNHSWIDQDDASSSGGGWEVGDDGRDAF